MLTVTTIKCPNCKDIVYSRARYDFRVCSCGACFIDGGLDYIRLGPLKEEVSIKEIKTSTMEIDATAGDLFVDWNLSEDRYGLIKEKK